MSLVVTAVVAVGGALCASLIGLPVLMMTSGRAQTRRLKPRDRAREEPAPIPTVAFTPLRMEPFPMKWPSEVERPPSRTLVLKWPSENWNDPDFGRVARADLARADAAAEVANTRAEAMRKTRVAANQPVRAPSQAEPPPQHKSKKKSRPVQNDAEAEFFAASRPSGVPSHAEVTEMVRKLGLAGAVDEIRSRTGWEFKKAAEHLAEALREGR